MKVTCLVCGETYDNWENVDDTHEEIFNHPEKVKPSWWCIEED